MYHYAVLVELELGSCHMIAPIVSNPERWSDVDD